MSGLFFIYYERTVSRSRNFTEDTKITDYTDYLVSRGENNKIFVVFMDIQWYRNDTVWPFDQQPNNICSERTWPGTSCWVCPCLCGCGEEQGQYGGLVIKFPTTLKMYLSIEECSIWSC